MSQKTYSIFGAGASGLYTAWRLLQGQAQNDAAIPLQLAAGDTLELFDWGQYDFSKEHPGTREPGARVCTWHYQNQPGNSYLEVGGMRYSQWDTSAPDCNGGLAGGHRLVTTVIQLLGLDQYSVPFNESTNPLYYLRTKNLYLNQISSFQPAPYHADHYAAAAQPDQGFAILQDQAMTTDQAKRMTRTDWDNFYQNGRIEAEQPASAVFQKGELLTEIGYWNLMYDQLGTEGYNYAADGNGYSSNVINWNAAVAIEANNEFTPGTKYKTLTTGYSGMFTALFAEIVRLAKEKKVNFKYAPNTRLHSILQREGVIHYTLATRANPCQTSATGTANAAWLAMPRHSLELVAQATRFQANHGLDVLNAQPVRLYLEAAIMQPSYKVGMFFDQEWWLNATYPPQTTGYVVTQRVIAQLHAAGFPTAYLAAIQGPAKPKIIETPYASAASLIQDVAEKIGERLTIQQEKLLLNQSVCNTIGPSVTDTPIRQVVYFGNNAHNPAPGSKPVYGLLGSYDDETFVSFWREMELEPNQERRVPESEDCQTLRGPQKVPLKMVKMLRKQLAEVHFGPNSDYRQVPEPLEAAYMDWSLPPFNAGYHAWAAHFDIAQVQQNIRKPSQLIPGADANIFIVGEAYSNDQAWVEGAYCTAESVLNDFFGIKPLIDNTNYPFICQVQKQ